MSTDRIDITCPSCGKTASARANMAGKSVKCPHCRTTFTVPQPAITAQPFASLEAEPYPQAVPAAEGSAFSEPAPGPSGARGDRAVNLAPLRGWTALGSVIAWFISVLFALLFLICFLAKSEAGTAVTGALAGTAVVVARAFEGVNRMARGND